MSSCCARTDSPARGRRRWLRHLVRSTLAPALLALPGRSPASAPHVLVGSVTGGAGGHPISLRLIIPDTAPPWPLVVYSHGLGGGLESGSLWTETWRQAGYASLHVLHLATSEAVFVAHDAAATQRSVQQSLALDQVPSRCADLRRVLSHLLAPETDFGQYIDAARLVIAGHSYGALTAMALAGRTLVPSLRDARYAAAIALSPGVGQLAGAKSMARIDIPMMCVTGSLDERVGLGLPEHRVTAGVALANRLAVFEHLPRGGKCLLFIDGGDHMTFAGEQAVSAMYSRAPGWKEALEPQRIRVIQSQTTRFLLGLGADKKAGAAQPTRTDLGIGYLVEK